MLHTHTARLVTMRARVAILGITLVLSGVAFVATSPTARAFCENPNTAGQLNPSWGREHTPNVSTCDGDGIYKGKVTDKVSDGFCVTVQFKEGSTIYTQGVSCNATGLNYTFWDQNGNTWSSIRICKQGTATCSPASPLFTYTQSY